jgi:tetratricopeptide (TPR) repeat protein
MVKQGEKMVRVERPCTRYHRLGKAHVAIAFNLTASATGQVIAAHTYEDSDRSSTHATDEQPAAINSGAMLEGLRSNITARFAKVILPWRETLRVVFGRCGDARGLCEAGAASVRAGDFESAISSFQSAIQQLEAAPERDNDDIAEAYWNRGIAREYSGDFPGAIADIVQASQLNPGHRTYPVELQNVRQMQAEQEQLRQQGVGEVGAEDVQEGGAP